MRLSRNVIAAAFISIAMLLQPVMATVVGGSAYVCPACGHKFSSAAVQASSSFGGDEEGRPLSMGMDTQEFRLHDCPHCHYCGFGSDFAENGTVPTGAAMQTIRDALAKKAANFPRGPLWPLERVAAAELCFQAGDVNALRFEQLYRLGAWLADDAGEDELASNYRIKAAENLALSAGLAGKPAEEYRAAIAAYARGDFAAAAPLLASVRVSLDAETAAMQKKWKPVRDEILRRTNAQNAPTDTKPAETQPAAEVKDDELDWDSLIDEAKPAELVLVNQRLSMRRMARRIDMFHEIAALGALGQAAAFEKARAGDIDLRRTFVFAFGRHANAAMRKQIDEIINPQPPDEKKLSGQDARWLSLVWEQMGGWSADRPAPNIPELIKDLKSSVGAEPNAERANAIADLIAVQTPEAGAALVEDFRRDPISYGEQPLFSTDNPTAWKTMALDSGNALKLAKHLFDPAKPADAGGRLALRPLAYCADAESRAFLESSLNNPDAAARLEGARCLVIRRDHKGAAALISLATADDTILPKMEPEIAAMFVSLMTSDDLPALQKLKQKWPGPIQRKDDDTKAMAAVTVRAALAQADKHGSIGEYDKAVDQLLDSDITGQDPARLPWEDTVPERMEMLGWCGNLYYSPHIDKLLRPMLGTGISDYGVATTIRMLARNGNEEEDDVLTAQLTRPVPMMVKRALIETTGRLHIQGREAMVARWAKSVQSNISAPAEKALKP